MQQGNRHCTPERTVVEGGALENAVTGRCRW